ncbi:YveK family protein [Paenibacillus koleovorans]|uniref:YveK family protein n=1 Tax=Paenibacillus koleovorans TaxID=121608 RepID=UPI000FDC5783|nr:Wzz/FepE/Etk N-terminal domain-containing protein [Paenibacillus koleovorans]
MELDLKDYFKIIMKRLWLLIAIVVVACTTTGVVSFFFMTPIYEASTKLIVNKSSERVGIEQLTLNDVNLNIRIIDTYKEVIKSPYIMEIVAKEYPQFSLTAEQLIGKVRVNSVNNTQVMTLIVQDPSHSKAVEIVNAVSKVFQREIPNVMNVDNVSLLSEAKILNEPAPVKPDPFMNLAISLVVALMAGIGVIFLLEYLDDTIKTEADVLKYLELPVLTMVVKMKPEDIHSSQDSKLTRGRKAGEAKHVNATLNQ